jgi:hypothetical protein
MNKRRFDVGNRVQDRDQRIGTVEAIIGSVISVRWDDDATMDEMKKADLTKLTVGTAGPADLDEADESPA